MTAPIWIEKSAAALAEAASFSRAKTTLARADGERVARDVYALGVLHVDELDETYGAWSDLARRALEPNAFFEPGFALSLARHSPGGSRPRFVAVWREAEGARRLDGLFPLARERSWPSGGGFARLWLDKQMALAAPLVDRDRAEEVIAQFLDWLAKTRAVGVVFPRLVENGPLHQALVAAAGRSGRSVAALDRFERAMLSPGSDRDELWTRGASKKALKDLHRRGRRLAEQGSLAFSVVSSPRDVRDALEQFLTLEASGWKGASGALLSDPALSAFVRGATRMLARENKCRVASLRLAGRPLAMGVLIESQVPESPAPEGQSPERRGRAYFWKIAFDETFRAQAPGIHLLYELTRAQAARGDIDMTNSCAIANHPMIDRFWPDRVAICDLAVQTRGAGAFEAARRVEALRLGLRAWAKRVVKRLLGRKDS